MLSYLFPTFSSLIFGILLSLFISVHLHAEEVLRTDTVHSYICPPPPHFLFFILLSCCCCCCLFVCLFVCCFLVLHNYIVLCLSKPQVGPKTMVLIKETKTNSDVFMRACGRACVRACVHRINQLSILYV